MKRQKHKTLAILERDEKKNMFGVDGNKICQADKISSFSSVSLRILFALSFSLPLYMFKMEWNGMDLCLNRFSGLFWNNGDDLFEIYIYIYRYYTELCQTIYRSMPQKVFEWQKKAILLHIRAIFIGFCMRVCVWLLISCFFLLRSDHLIYLQCALSNYQTWAENDNCACKLRNKNLKLKEPNNGNNNKW